MLILSGNLSFLNYLTIIPALACFDDTALIWRLVFPSHVRHEAAEAYQSEGERLQQPLRRPFPTDSDNDGKSAGQNAHNTSAHDPSIRKTPKRVFSAWLSS